MMTIRKREGFEGQRAIVLPKKILDVCAATSPVNALYITDMGFYPYAKYHYRERLAGVAQAILIYCIEGNGWLEMSTGKFPISANEFLIIPAGMPHKYGADEKKPWSIYWIHFNGIQSPYFTALLSKQLKYFVNQSPYVEERIKIFDSIYKTLEAGYSLDNLAYSNIAFSYFIASLAFTDKFVLPHNNQQKDPVDISIEYMQNHLSEPLTLNDLAASINLSVSHYSSLFRKRTGHSPVVYFNHLKIQHACQYLQFTTLRINEIASKLGIDDPYYFSRMFTKTMGISPFEYRKRRINV